MTFLEDLLTKEADTASFTLPDYEFFVFPYGKEPIFGRLFQLQNPGDRRNRDKIMQCIGARKTTLDVFYSSANLPIILPTAELDSDLPPSFHTVNFRAGADISEVLYDFIEDPRWRGDQAILHKLFVFDRVSKADDPFYLGNGIEFNPSKETIWQDGENMYHSVVERVVYNDAYDRFATFHIGHEVNRLQEIMGFTLSYWIHDAEHHVTPKKSKRRPVHATYAVRRETRGGRLVFGGSAGLCDVRGGQYKPWVKFAADGGMVHAVENKWLKDKKDGHTYHCDFNNTLKCLVDLMFEMDEAQFYELGKLGYLKYS